MRSVRRPTLPLLLLLVAGGSANSEPPDSQSGTDVSAAPCQSDTVEQQFNHNAYSLSGDPGQEDNSQKWVTRIHEAPTRDDAEVRNETA